MKPIVVVGSVNMDLVSCADRLPSPGETIIGTLFEMHSGGKGANQAVAIARLGHPAILLGATGADIFGQKLLSTLNEFGVDTSHIRIVPGSSGVATIAVDSAGENTIVVVPGANSQVTSDYLLEKLEVLRNAGMVLAQLEIPMPTIEWLAATCAEHDVPFMLDPAPASPLSPSLFRNVAWFTPNQTEALFYSGEDSTRETVNTLFRAGIANLILKRGREGAVLATQGEIVDTVDAFPVEAVDTTAAGDAFNGAFSVGLMRGHNVTDSARFAAAAAAVSATRRGAQSSMPSEADVRSFLQAHAPAISMNDAQ